MTSSVVRRRLPRVERPTLVRAEIGDQPGAPSLAMSVGAGIADSADLDRSGGNDGLSCYCSPRLHFPDACCDMGTADKLGCDGSGADGHRLDQPEAIGDVQDRGQSAAAQ